MDKERRGLESRLVLKGLVNRTLTLLGPSSAALHFRLTPFGDETEGCSFISLVTGRASLKTHGKIDFNVLPNVVTALIKWSHFILQAFANPSIHPLSKQPHPRRSLPRPLKPVGLLERSWCGVPIRRWHLHPHGRHQGVCWRPPPR